MFLTVTAYVAAFIFWFVVGGLVSRWIAQRGYGYLVAMAALVPICVAVMLALVFSVPKEAPDWMAKAIGFPAIFVMIAICLLPMYFASKTERLTGSLASRFKRMGDMSGMRIGEIVERVGPFQSRSQHAEGSLVQWMQEGYHIAIVVDENGYFKAIQHEANTR